MIKHLLTNSTLTSFVSHNLQESLASIGFTSQLIAELTDNLLTLDIEKFQQDFRSELEHTYRIGFFQKIVPDYFEKYVVPEILAGGKFLDVGCGTGILVKRLSETKNFDELIGIDISEYTEWKSFRRASIDFRVVSEDSFLQFLDDCRPDSIALTWTLHHMDYPVQEQYLQDISSHIKKGAHLVVLEDSYSNLMPPENGRVLWESFMALDAKGRKVVMSAYDWIANRILGQRITMPMPFAYRTMGEWVALCDTVGLRLVSKNFIGFPEQRDINTPQGLLVFRK